MNKKIEIAENGWKITDEKTILRTKVAKIVSAQVQSNRTGGTDEFYRLVFPDWVNIIALTVKNEIVLVRQLRFGSKRVEVEIPGGAIEHGESPVQAGCRELLEETGYAGREAKVIGCVSPNPAIQNNHCYTVLIENATQTTQQSMDVMEDIEVFVVPLEKIDEYITEGLISHGLVLNAFMFLDRLRSLSVENSQGKGTSP